MEAKLPSRNLSPLTLPDVFQKSSSCILLARLGELLSPQSLAQPTVDDRAVRFEELPPDAYDLKEDEAAPQTDVEKAVEINNTKLDIGLSKTFSQDSDDRDIAFDDFVRDRLTHLPGPEDDKDAKKLKNCDNHTKEMVSLILGLERTLFAALNNAWLLSFGGIGLMTVGQDDDRALVAGSVVIVAGIFCAAMAYGSHVVRVSQLQRGDAYPSAHTFAWSSLIACLTVTVLSLEMYFGILYPYLQRSAAVTITSDRGAL